MNLNGNYCLTTTSKRPTHNKRMVMRVCVCVCMIWNRDCLFVLFLPVKLLTITAFNRSFHNGTWNSPRMRHSFIFLPKEECNDSKLGTLRRVWRYQREVIRNSTKGLNVEEEQTTQYPKEKVQKDKQRSTTYTYKAKDRVTRSPLKTGDELRCSGRVGSSCSTSGIRPASTIRIHNVAVWLLFGQVPFLRENYVATTYFRYVICKSLWQRMFQRFCYVRIWSWCKGPIQI
jgi:hypothetical protein